MFLGAAEKLILEFRTWKTKFWDFEAGLAFFRESGIGRSRKWIMRIDPADAEKFIVKFDEREN